MIVRLRYVLRDDIRSVCSWVQQPLYIPGVEYMSNPSKRSVLAWWFIRLFEGGD